jgi:hypothetical protein
MDQQHVAARSVCPARAALIALQQMEAKFEAVHAELAPLYSDLEGSPQKRLDAYASRFLGHRRGPLRLYDLLRTVGLPRGSIYFELLTLGSHTAPEFDCPTFTCAARLGSKGELQMHEFTPATGSPKRVQRKNMLRNLISVVVCVFVANSASAQTDADALRGLKSIDLFIEGVDDEAQRCGITETLIRDAFLYPISQSKLQFAHHAGGPTFFVRVSLLIQRHPEQCISFVEAAVRNYQKVQLDYLKEDDPPTWAWVNLWPSGWGEASLIVGQPAQRVRNVIENVTKKFLTAWSLANKP